MKPINLSRRRFLTASFGTLAGVGLTGLATGQERPRVVSPRATSGDDLHEPDWKERLSISVGPQNADLVGTGERVVQAAVDYLARKGGGTVRILPGTYRFRNAVYLASGVRIQGSGEDSIIIKEPSVKSKLAEDSDWYDQEITLADASGFQVGDGVCLRARNPDHRGNTVIKRTLIARDGKRFKLDRGLRENLWLSGEPTCATLFPLFSGEEIENVVIENIVLDGNREKNDNLDGNYAGCIWLQDCNRVTISKVTARNYNGDGISWQVCHDVVVQECHSHDNTGLGLHPGSGSQRPVIRNNRMHHNAIGLFWCWGVKFGLAEKNRIEDNSNYGISIGHCDTDNVMRDNDVLRSGKVGILFRDDARGRDFWANRNLVENNRVVDSGGADGVGIDVQGKTHDVVIRNNELKETRAAMNRVGIRLAQATRNITLAGNRIDGFSTEVADLRG